MKVNTAYTGNYFLLVTFDLVYFFVFFSLWTSVYKSGNIVEISGYTLSGIISYYFISEIIFKFADVMSSIYLNWQIWSGYLTNDLIKPWNVLSISYIDAFSEKIINLIVSLPATVVMFLIAREFIILPTGINTLYLVVTIALGFVMNCAFNLCIHVLCLKFGDQESNIELANFLAMFLAGAFFPLAFLPVKIEFIFSLLPFKYIFYVPANIFLNKMNLHDIIIAWAMIIMWTLVFILTYKVIYRKTIKYYSGTGR
jgi:ABC-2 type transport system permease protein